MLPFPVQLVDKMTASKFICCFFFSHPAAFGFRASSPQDNITLNAANKKTDQSLTYFQTDIHTAACATLDTK